MALAAVLDSVESLAPDIAKEYKLDEKSKKYILDVTGTKVGDKSMYELVDTSGLKSALEKERTEAKNLKDAVKAFEGLDAKEARQALIKVEEMKNWTPDEKVKAQLEATKNDLLKQHNAEKAELATKVGKLSGALKQNLVIASATKAITDAKGSPTLLLPHVEKFVRLREDGDNFVVEILGPEGNVRVDSQGNPLGIPQFVEELKGHADFARAFDASGAAGTGAGGGGGGGMTQSPVGGKRIIKASDQKTKNQYAAEIASGKAIVVDG
jgi:hypothetical protein